MPNWDSVVGHIGHTIGTGHGINTLLTLNVQHFYANKNVIRHTFSSLKVWRMLLGREELGGGGWSVAPAIDDVDADDGQQGGHDVVGAEGFGQAEAGG